MTKVNVDFLNKKNRKVPLIQDKNIYQTKKGYDKVLIKIQKLCINDITKTVSDIFVYFTVNINAL